jgi:hypothetical protein
VAAALQNAEHFLAAAGALLKEKGEEFDDLRSFLLQVDRCLCASQYLNLGTIANFSLARRQEILQKSNVSEFIKETLLFSPLHKDQLFGTSLRKLQEELHKEPPTVKVDVNLSGSGSRRVSVPAKQDSRRSQGTSKSNNQSLHGSRNLLKRTTESSSFPATAGSSNKKSKVVKGKKPQF